MTTQTTQIVDNSWETYFATHLEFSALTPKGWDSRDGVISRYYFGDSYLQRKMVTAARTGSSYYDQHRMSRGDMSEVVSDNVTWVGDAALLAEIIKKAGPFGVADDRLMNELWQRFVALENRPKSRRRR